MSIQSREDRIKSLKSKVRYRRECLDRLCAGNRVEPLLNPPGQHEGTIVRGDADHELSIYYDVEYEPAQRGGWDDPSWDESAKAHNAYFRRDNGLWYPIELTEGEAARLGGQYIADCREADYDYDAQDRADARNGSRYDY
jgi:hypothetical protein